MVGPKSITIVFMLVIIFLVATYSFSPNLDLDIARQFYQGGKFTPPAHCSFITHSFKLYTVKGTLLIGALTAILHLASRFINILKVIKPIFYKSIYYLNLNLIISSGLLVELLKNIVARARPDHILLRGKLDEFTQFFEISKYCSHNCSFPSGDSSVGFFYIPIFMIIFRGRIGLASLCGIAVGVVMSYCRLAAGKHFFSDTLFSFLIVYYIALTSYALIFKKKN